MCAARVVTDDEHVGLAAVQEAERHAGVGGVEQRALAFDHVPMLRGGGRAEHLRGARFEVADHRIHRHAAPGDEDAGLPGRAEIDVDAAFRERAREGEGGVFFAERAVGADGEQALAGALLAGSDRDIRRRRADVDKAAAVTRRRSFQLRRIGQTRVHAADDVEAGFERFEQRRDPAVVNRAADIGDADHEPARAARNGLARREERQARGDGRAARPFADAALAGPVAQAERGLGVAGFGGVAEEQQVRLRQNLDLRIAQYGIHIVAQNFRSKPTPIVRGAIGTPPTWLISPVAAFWRTTEVV